jgi:hypothetical protein
MIRSVALLLFVAVLSLQQVPPRVRFIRPPHFVALGQIVKLSVWVEPHKDDRKLVIAAVDPNCVGSIDQCNVGKSTIQLGDGDNRKLWDTYWSAMFPGEFTLIAVVSTQSAEVARASVPVQVLEGF